MTTQRCECPENTEGGLVPQWMYVPEEYKAMNHATNACPGDYDVKRYERDGKFLWLCSCCFFSDDEEVIQ
jgi:hypothetical protein